MEETKIITTQVVVIGGGPSGSAAATMLAKMGISTTLLEQELFPRFHIGESLLPNCNTHLKKMGVWDKIQNSDFVIKRGGQFMSPNKSHFVLNIFSEGLVKNMDMTYQVERAKFDEILLNHAKASGAEIYQETRVTGLEKQGEGWQVTALHKNEKIIVNCQWLVDASGRKCVAGRHLKLKREPLPIPGRLAIYNHFTQVNRPEGERSGDTLVVRLRDAWVWSIPLSNGITSIGVVMQSGDSQLRHKNLDDIFWKKIQESPVLVDLTRNAVCTDTFKTDSDYSYAYQEYAVENAVLVGDAASFIDPVFSSGVCIALESGISAAAMIQKAIKNPEQKNHLCANYTKKIKSNMVMMRKLIDMFYNIKGAELLLSPRPILKIPQAVNAILAGVLNPGWNIRWRLWIFEKIYSRHLKKSLVPPIDW